MNRLRHGALALETVSTEELPAAVLALPPLAGDDASPPPPLAGDFLALMRGLFAGLLRPPLSPLPPLAARSSVPSSSPALVGPPPRRFTMGSLSRFPDRWHFFEMMPTS
eukprot:CAMPEP_0171744552 /NCGR_PEP_ID=MMETSP0991-20121206/37577_1 /TAXON_ID=483369 /ORGANISM="non described non described, Strain CCMP2098" /LENGTH=108 /DNA_ID=CAMNT_0012343743 /DNA_START=13 /DNA_END=339 /DNA_ORIENTATION=-